MPAKPTDLNSSPQYRVWFERRPPESHLALLAEIAVVADVTQQSNKDPLAGLLGSHAIIASGGITYDGRLMDSVPTLLVISRTGVGIDNISVAAASERHIAVCNAPEAGTISTAEHAIALMFAVAKRIKAAQAAIALRQPNLLDELGALELKDLTLGIVGLGHIGRHVAHIALAVGMSVRAFDPYVGSESMEEIGVDFSSSLEELLATSNVVSLHIPLTPETRHLINRDRLAQMKPEAILINAARGGLVDERALLEALEDGRISGAGLDVFDPEPPKAANPLLHRSDVIATPHVATATTAARDRLWRTAIQQAIQVLRDERPPHLVNPEVWLARAPHSPRSSDAGR
jgi:D-3-phosphoglycerate dehydrogenase